MKRFLLACFVGLSFAQPPLPWLSVTGTVIKATGSNTPALVCVMDHSAGTYPWNAGSDSVHVYCSVGGKAVLNEWVVVAAGSTAIGYNSASGDAFSALLSLDQSTTSIAWQVAINGYKQNGEF